MHTFEVTNSSPVLSEWRTLDDRTFDEGKKARGLFFGAHNVPRKAEPWKTSELPLPRAEYALHRDEEVRKRLSEERKAFGEQLKKPVGKQQMLAPAQPAAPSTKQPKPVNLGAGLTDERMRTMLWEQQMKKTEVEKRKVEAEKRKAEEKQALLDERAAIEFLAQEDVRVLSEEILGQERQENREDAVQQMVAIPPNIEDRRATKTMKQSANEKQPEQVGVPKGQAAARTAGVRFGEISPPRNHLDSSRKSQPRSSSDGNRWASYSNLPVTFNEAPVPLPTASNEEKETKTTTKSAFDVMNAAAADQHVRSHTVQLPSTPRQKKEHQPLLEMFWATKSQHAASKTEDAKKDYQPLLELFEKQLHQLGNGTSAATNCAQHQETAQQPLEATPEPKRAQALQTPGELLTLSIQSLLSGVHDLASAFKLTSSELQQQIAVARRDFPINMDQALKASLGATDTLRSELSAPRVQPSSQQSDRGTQASKPPTADQATNTDKSTKEVKAAHQDAKTKKAAPYPPPAPFNQQELVKQDMRIDAVVEKMRLALLEMGWRAPATPKGIYTRADILEDFLSYFHRMQDQAELRGVRLGAADPTNANASFQHPPPVPAKEPKKESKKVRDDMKLPVDWPYAWDFKVPLNDDGATTKAEGDDRSEYQSFLWDDAAEHIYQPLAQSESAPAPLPEANDNLVQKKSLDAWRPLIPQTTAGYQFNPASVMSSTLSTPEQLDRKVMPAKFPIPESYFGSRRESNTPIAELADESVMDKFPTVAQFEQRGMQKQASTKPQPMEPKAGPPTLPSSTMVPHRADWKIAEPKQKLSTQTSMPVLRTQPARQPPAESKPRELYAGFPFQVERASKAPPMLYKSASMSFKPASHRQENVDSTRRSNTVREPSGLSREAAGRARNAAVSRSIRRAEEADRNREIQASNNIEDCRKRLVEMGFMVTEARRVSTEVHGDLEKAIDLMEEEASKRKAAKGKGRYMPGAYDDELFG